MRREDVVKRYRVDRETGCWRYTGAITKNGYGCARVGGRVQYAHQIAYELAHGPMPDGTEIDHVYARGCRHKDCINPAHLEAVTRFENIRRQRQVTIDAETVAIVKARVLDGDTSKEIAETMGINLHTVLNIRRGRTWADILPAA